MWRSDVEREGGEMMHLHAILKTFEVLNRHDGIDCFPEIRMINSL